MPLSITVDIDPTGRTDDVIIHVGNQTLQLTRDEWKEVRRRVNLRIRPPRAPKRRG